MRWMIRTGRPFLRWFAAGILLVYWLLFDPSQGHHSWLEPFLEGALEDHEPPGEITPHHHHDWMTGRPEAAHPHSGSHLHARPRQRGFDAAPEWGVRDRAHVADHVHATAVEPAFSIPVPQGLTPLDEGLKGLVSLEPESITLGIPSPRGPPDASLQ
ncbi:MAG: hypothetical protein HY652_01485 [Acidobacteria bacterium]|nr:hypothetical protein [Acidobacteriota bacterium]